MSEQRIENVQITQSEFNNIICPNLRIGINEGHLHPDVDGWVTQQELKDYFHFIGVDKKSRVVNKLVSLGKRVIKQKRDNKVNLINFKGTKLDHGSGSGIINNDEGFSQARLDLLKSYLNKDGRLYIKDTIAALNQFHQCPFHKKTKLGTNLASFEFASIIGIYGQFDEKGAKFFTADDIDDIWKYNCFPRSWTAPEKPHFGTGPAYANYVKVMIKRRMFGWKKVK